MVDDNQLQNLEGGGGGREGGREREKGGGGGRERETDRQTTIVLNFQYIKDWEKSKFNYPPEERGELPLVECY